MISSSTIPLFMAIPLGGAFLCALLGKRVKTVVDGIGIMAVVGVFMLSIFSVITLDSIEGGRLTTAVGNWQAPFGILLVLDSFTSFMLVTVNLIAFLVVIYSISYMERYTAKWKFYTLFLLMLAGMNGVIITGDLFNLFVFLEVASIASYALVAFGTGKHELEAAFKYAVMGSLGSLLILLGIGFLYSYTSTLNMADMAEKLQMLGDSRITLTALVMFLMGFGLKAAIVPFHAWLPDAHPSAPAPISAMLSGVLIKALGIYAICRLLFNVFGMTPQISSVLMILAAISMGVGAVLALKQWDMKRLLAYSSISQVGFILLGIGIGTPLAILGALFHLFNHAVFKSLLFLDSGAVEYATGTRDLRKMGGLSSRLPITSGTTLIASMSVAGIPPFAGFWSKLIIILAAVQAGHWFYAGWAVVISMITLAYVMKITRYGFLGKIKKQLEVIVEVPSFMRIALVALAVICVLGGLLLLPGVRDGFLGQASSVLSRGVITLSEVVR
jgi:multicomponent Na+:H+ antiporter subunit D